MGKSASMENAIGLYRCTKCLYELEVLVSPLEVYHACKKNGGKRVNFELITDIGGRKDDKQIPKRARR